MEKQKAPQPSDERGDLPRLGLSGLWDPLLSSHQKFLPKPRILEQGSFAEAELLAGEGR